MARLSNQLHRSGDNHLLRLTTTALYSGLITLSILLSFRNFAANLTPDFNSDHAIHVLMSYDLQLPQDLYYWGQSRLGSFVPILTHALLKITPLTPIQAISYVQYGSLIIGYFCLASLLRLQHSKLIFALVWFLPLAAFPELLMIAQPYGPQFMMLGLALVLLNRVRINDLPSRYIIDQVTNNQIFRNQTIHNYILVALAVLCLFIGFWISELSVIFLFLLLIQFINLLISQLKLFLKTSSQQSQSQRLKQIYRSPLFGMSLTATLMSLFGISFILYAKHYARNRSDEYATFGNLTEIQEIASHLATSVVNTLMFQSENIFLSLHAVLVLVLLISLSLVVPQQIKRGVRPLQTNWLFVFAAGALLSLILLIPSHWVYINNISLRYFTVVYVAGWMAALLLVEALRGQAQRWLLMLLGIMALTASLSLFRDGALSSSPVSEISRLQEVKTLGKVGIIGNYWSSYNLCAVDPASLNCTARDSLSNQKIPCETPSSQPQEIDGVRCPRCARRVLQAETIYLVKRKWLSTFPSEIQQFGRCLTQVGPPRRVASHFMAPYRVKQP